MSPELDQLDIDALLLLYVSGELSADDAAEVDRRVAADAVLAAQLQRVRETQSFVDQTLRVDDEQARLPMSADTAVRRVSRAMKQWQVDRLTKKSMAPVTTPRFRLPVWSYPVGIAAAVIIAVLIWARSLPDAGTNILTPDQIAELHRKNADDLASEFASADGQEVESLDLLTTPEMSKPDDFLDDVFLRSGG